MSIADFFFGRKQNKTNSRRSAKLNRNAVRTRNLAMEPLETRDLLSVTTGLIDDSAYAELRAQYPDFNLPANQSNLNVMTVDCNLNDLKNAISQAKSSTKSDLILIKTSDAVNTIIYSSSSDQITINSTVTIIGWGTRGLTLNANEQCRVLTIADNVSANLGNINITNGNVYVSSSTNNVKAYGGGIYSTGSLTLTNCTISYNSVSCSNTSSSYNYTSNSYGGGIYSTGTLTLTGCIISGNVSSSFVASSRSNSYGGGIYSSGVTTLTNCILSNNKTIASSNLYGGGIYCTAKANIINSTITNNSSYGIYVNNSSSNVNIYNSIVVQNSLSDVYKASGSINAYNTLSSYSSWSNGSNNIVYDSSKPLFVSSSDLRLANNSQAINKGNNSYTVDSSGQPISTDLAGIPRIIGGTVDLGAYEYDSRTKLSVPHFELSSQGFSTSVIIMKVNNATGYKIEYSQKSNFTDSTTIDAQEGENTLEGLQKFQTYYVRVKSTGDTDFIDSDYSASQSFVTVPTLTGLTLSTDAPMVGTTITTTLTPADATAEYQWYSGETPISGETNSSYTVTTDQLGQTIKCVATGTGDYTGTAVFAEATVVAPEGYNESDYQKMVVFFEQTDKDGVKNGTKLNANYDPANPLSWTGISWETVDGEDRITSISIQNKSLVGDADFSNLASLTYLNCSTNQLTSLNVSNNTSLTNLLCDSNLLTTLNLSNNILLNEIHCYNNQLSGLILCDCIDLQYLYCNSNQLTELDLSTNTSLRNLDCSNNQLKELNLSECDNLFNFSCYSNQLSTLDLTNNVNLSFFSIGDSYLSSVLLVNKVLGKLKVYFYNSRYTVSNSVETITVSNSGSYTPTELPFTAVNTTTGNTILFDSHYHLTGLTLSTDAPEMGTTITAEFTPADATAAFVWFSGSTPVENATNSSFTVTEAQIGQTITCVAIGTGDYAGIVYATTLAVPGYDLDVPTGLALSSAETTVTAAWSAVDNASGYTLEYQPAGAESWSVITGINDSAASFNGVAGATYNVRVKANGTGNYSDSEFSEFASIYIPIPLTGLTFSTTTPEVGTIITTTLTPSDATAGYQWYSGETLIEGENTSSFVVTEDQIGKTITCIATGTGDYTGTVSATTAAVPVPVVALDAPADVALSVYNATVTASWSAVENASSYTLEYKPVGAENWTALPGLEDTTASFVGVSGTMYNVRVKAVGTGDYSDSTYTEINTDKPTGPVVAINANKVTVSWVDDSPAADSVRYRVAGTTRWTTKKLKAGITSLTFNATIGANYDIEVLLDQQENNVLQGSTIVLDQPKLTSVKNELKDDAFQINVTNYAAKNLAANVKQAIVSVNGVMTTLKIADQQGETALANGGKVAFSNGLFTFSEMNSNTSYKVMISFSDGHSVSKTSSALTVKTLKSPYLPPVIVSASAVSDTAITVTWETVFGKNSTTPAQKYTVQYSTDGTKWTNATTGATGNSFTIQRLKGGNVYQVRVLATKDNAFEASAPSEVLTAETLTAPKTAIEKNSIKDDSFQVNVTNYPTTNLVKATSITVKSDKFGETAIAIQNGSGSATFENGMVAEFENGALTFTNVPSNTQQKIQVNFSDGVCTTAWSAALTVKTTIAPYNKPNLTSATAVSSTSVQVEWSSAVGKNTDIPAQSYTVQYTTDGERWTNANTKVVGTSYTITGLKTGTTYLVAVIANKDARFNASLPSESRQVTTL